MDSATKPFWQSKTLLGILIALLPTVLGWLGIEFDDAQTQALAAEIAQVLGGLLAIVGRFTARAKLTAPGSSGSLPFLLLGIVLALTTGCAGLKVSGSVAAEVDGKSVKVEVGSR